MEPSQLGDIRLYAKADLDQAEFHAIAGGTTSVFSKPRPGDDGVNEDSAALIPLGDGAAILAVADGCGGMPGGEEASSLALKKLIEAVQAAADAEHEVSMRAAILNGFEEANQAVIALGIGAATTLAVVEVQGATIRTYHVGDSMILVTGQRGRVKQQTVSHSPVGYALESGMLSETQAIKHEDRHVVSNIVGTPDMRIELGPTIELARRDTVIIASDGLGDNLLLDEIVDSVRKGTLSQVAHALATRSRARMINPEEGRKIPSHADDLTFIVFRLSGDKPAKGAG